MVPTSSGILPAKLYNHQKRLIKFISESRFVIGRKPRAEGYTTIMTAWMIWRLLFNIEHNAIFFKTTASAALGKRILNDMLLSLPEWLKRDTEYRRSGDKFYTEYSSLILRKWEPAIGGTLDNIYLDEFGYGENDRQTWAAIWPCLASNQGRKSRVIVLSTPTPNTNWFNETHKYAEQRCNGFSIYSHEAAAKERQLTLFEGNDDPC